MLQMLHYCMSAFCCLSLKGLEFHPVMQLIYWLISFTVLRLCKGVSTISPLSMAIGVLPIRHGLSGFSVKGLECLARPPTLALQNCNISQHRGPSGSSSQLQPTGYFLPGLKESHLALAQLKICLKTEENSYADFWKSFSKQFPPPVRYAAQQIPVTQYPQTLTSACYF